MTPAERLQEFIDYKAVRVSKFEKEIGAGNATIVKIIAENREISADIINKILAKYPELNRNWLLFNEGNMILDDGLKKAIPSIEYLISEAFRLHNLLEETLQSAAKDKDKIIELQEKIDQLKDEIGRKQA